MSEEVSIENKNINKQGPVLKDYNFKFTSRK